MSKTKTYQLCTVEQHDNRVRYRPILDMGLSKDLWTPGLVGRLLARRQLEGAAVKLRRVKK